MRPRSTRTVLAAALATSLVAPLVATALPAGTTAAQAATAKRYIVYKQWDTQRQLESGSRAGTSVVDGVLRLHRPVATRRYDDPHGNPTRTYDLGRWTSPWQAASFGLDEAIPSWEARTPGDSFVQVQLRGRNAAGRTSRWYTVASWAAGDRHFHRTSHGSQTDALGSVNVDTVRTRDGVTFTGWQVRVTLLRRSGTKAVPRLDTVGAMVSRVPDVSDVATSQPGVASAAGTRLWLPKYSQMIHDGHYPAWDGGGEAWCSPTSVSMVLGRLGRLPSARRTSWVPDGHPDPHVDHAARMQYDYRYDGAGNWPFSTAYASTLADAAFVTRLRNLREAEKLVAAGIPVVASVRFGRGELDGAPISSTNGHLLVIAGFTTAGDVVVNDPAAPRNRSVRRTYDRGQFEDAWIGGSGGVSYVIRNDDQPLPAARTRNW
jgi:hypothetical protein